MIVVVADTSGLLAALDEDHPEGEGARRVLREAGALVISPLLLSELDHVGRRVLGRDAASHAVDDISRWASSGRAILPQVTHGILDIAQSLRARYADLDLDLTDAVSMALAAQFRTNAVLTLDRRDFRAVRPLTHHPAFQLLPDDA